MTPCQFELAYSHPVVREVMAAPQTQSCELPVSLRFRDPDSNKPKGKDLKTGEVPIVRDLDYSELRETLRKTGEKLDLHIGPGPYALYDSQHAKGMVLAYEPDPPQTMYPDASRPLPKNLLVLTKPFTPEEAVTLQKAGILAESAYVVSPIPSLTNPFLAIEREDDITDPRLFAWETGLFEGIRNGLMHRGVIIVPAGGDEGSYYRQWLEIPSNFSGHDQFNIGPFTIERHQASVSAEDDFPFGSGHFTGNLQIGQKEDFSVFIITITRTRLK